jgi:hypothetical protein
MACAMRGNLELIVRVKQAAHFFFIDTQLFGKLHFGDACVFCNVFSMMLGVGAPWQRVFPSCQALPRNAYRRRGGYTTAEPGRLG